MAAAAAPVFVPGFARQPINAAMKILKPTAPAISHVLLPSFSMNATPTKLAIARIVQAAPERPEAVSGARPMYD